MRIGEVKHFRRPMVFDAPPDNPDTIPAYAYDTKELNKQPQSTLLRDFQIGAMWIEADLLVTGQNSCKTTVKGVRYHKRKLRSQGYNMASSSIVLPVRNKHGKQFWLADGMHRAEAVSQLSEERRQDPNSDSKCGDEVYCMVLRGDTPWNVLMKISVGEFLS